MSARPPVWAAPPDDRLGWKIKSFSDVDVVWERGKSVVYQTEKAPTNGHTPTAFTEPPTLSVVPSRWRWIAPFVGAACGSMVVEIVARMLH